VRLRTDATVFTGTAVITVAGTGETLAWTP